MSRLPFSIKVLLEAALRQAEGFEITREAIETIANWGPDTAGKFEIPFKPARVILQDFTGVPSVVDLAALRSAMARMGGDANKINPVVPVDLVIDHSVQVDRFGSAAALFFTRSGSSSATANAMSSSNGDSAPLTTSASCRPPPASCIR